LSGLQRDLTNLIRWNFMARLHFFPAHLVFALSAAVFGGCEGVTQPATPAPTATTPATAPLAEDVIRWSIDNVESIAGHTPTVLGAPKVISDTEGKAVSFNGTSDGLILPVVPLAGMKAFTLEVLFRPESGGATEQRFLHSEDEAMHRVTVETRLTPDGKWALDTFLLTNRTTRLSLYDATKLHPADQWYWVALRYDGTTMSHFVNGVKELEGPVAFPAMGAAGRVSLGVRLNKVNWFKGQIREVRVTPRALDEADLQKNP
jgi:hypothetical protein